MSTTLHNANAKHAPAATEPGAIAVHQDGDVLTVTLANAAAGNEITAAMFAQFADALERQARKPTAKALVLRGEGASFCTGRERSANDLAAVRAEVERLIALKRALRATPLISIARVHGAAFGFGMGLAMLCDFAIVADDAPLAFPEMRAGLPPAAIMAYLGEYALPRHAFPLVLFGEGFTAAHARTIGLVNDVVPAANLDAAIDALLARIGGLDAASARACKEIFLTMQQGSFDANCRLATDALAVASTTLLRTSAP